MINNELLNLLSKYSDNRNKIYVLIRWFTFPFETFERIMPKNGIVLDIGCGEGAFSIYCALKNNKRKVIGIDIDRKRLLTAKKAGKKIKNAKFFLKNALSWDKKVDAIVISAFFHHLKVEEQTVFLKNSFTLVNPGGRLIIKEINKDDFIRSKLSRLWDYILYPRDKINYWSKDKLVKALNYLGYSVKTSREAIFFPGSTFFYICSK